MNKFLLCAAASAASLSISAANATLVFEQHDNGIVSKVTLRQNTKG